MVTTAETACIRPFPTVSKSSGVVQFWRTFPIATASPGAISKKAAQRKVRT